MWHVSTEQIVLYCNTLTQHIRSWIPGADPYTLLVIKIDNRIVGSTNSTVLKTRVNIEKFPKVIAIFRVDKNETKTIAVVDHGVGVRGALLTALRHLQVQTLAIILPPFVCHPSMIAPHSIPVQVINQRVSRVVASVCNVLLYSTTFRSTPQHHNRQSNR